MAKRGIPVDETLRLSRGTPSTLMAAALDAVGRHGEYRTASTSLERMAFARSFRPWWATTAAVVLGVTGVGLFFLLVRSAETFTLSIEEDHAGARVRIHGRILPKLLESLRDLCDGTAALPGAPAVSGSGVQAAVWPSAAATPQPPAQPLAPPPQPTNSPWLIPAGAPVVAPSPTLFDGSVAADDNTRMVERSESAGALGQPAWVLHLPDGSPIDLRSVVVIGRNPVGSAGDPAESTLLAVADASVSKTHAAVGVDDGGVWVVDRYSTNGTTIVDVGGTRRLVPGEPTRVVPGTVVHLGEYTMRVEER